MNKTMIGVIVVVLVLLVGYIVVKNSYAPSSNQSSQTAPSQTVAPNTVVIKNFSFQPSDVTVKAGSTVTWTNEDDATHTIKSSGFNSQELKKGDTFQFTFNTAGTFTYNCGIHPTMVGTVIVE